MQHSGRRASIEHPVAHWFGRIYGVLQYAYPPEFRRRYSVEMTQVFRDCCREAVTRGVWGILRFGVRAGADWITTSSRERMCSMRANDPSGIRFVFLAGIALSLTMMCMKVWLYRPLLAMPGGSAYVVEAAGLLVVYALVALWATNAAGPLRRAALLLGTPVGVLGGVMQMAQLTQERFVDLGAVWNGISAFGLLFCVFLLWAAAGYRAARRTGSIRAGAIVGLWSAMITMALLVMFGFALEFYLAMPRPAYVATWGEFKRSGWTDVHAFTIANTLDAAQSHLIAGPVLGAVFGAIAAIVMRVQGRLSPPAGTAGLIHTSQR